MREADGLAMSSRNLYLSADERSRAPCLNEALKRCAVALRSGVSIAAVQSAAREELEAAGFVPDYVEARHAETLAPVARLSEGPIRLLAAARLGTTRLIDNIAV